MVLTLIVLKWRALLGLSMTLQPGILRHQMLSALLLQATSGQYGPPLHTVRGHKGNMQLWLCRYICPYTALKVSGDFPRLIIIRVPISGFRL